MDKIISFKECWDMVKNNKRRKFKNGVDYIEIENDKYIVICPFNPNVMMTLNDKLYSSHSKFHFTSCICYSPTAFSAWFSSLYTSDRIKAFFIKKDIDLTVIPSNQPLTSEFTGWIDRTHKYFLHFAHLVNNHLATGIYGIDIGEDFFSSETALCDHIDDTCRDYVEEMNMALGDVFDELIEIYDKHKNQLNKRVKKFM